MSITFSLILVLEDVVLKGKIRNFITFHVEITHTYSYMPFYPTPQYTRMLLLCFFFKTQAHNHCSATQLLVRPTRIYSNWTLHAKKGCLENTCSGKNAFIENFEQCCCNTGWHRAVCRKFCFHRNITSGEHVTVFPNLYDKI